MLGVFKKGHKNELIIVIIFLSRATYVNITFLLLLSYYNIVPDTGIISVSVTTFWFESCNEF